MANNGNEVKFNIISQFGFDSKDNPIYGKEATLQWDEKVPTIEIPVIDGPIKNITRQRKKTKEASNAETNKTTNRRATRKSTKSDNNEMTH